LRNWRETALVAIAVALSAAAYGAAVGGCSSRATVPSQSCSLALPAPPDWRLHADGTVLRDSLGRTVFLRGVNAGGRSKVAPFVPFDFADGQYATALDAFLDRAASWGADALRVPFVWAALEPAQGQNDAAWLARYQQIVEGAWARGMWTVLDFHQDLYSENFCGDGFPGWTVPGAPAPHHDCQDWKFDYFTDTAMQQAFDLFWVPGSPVQAAYLTAWDVMIARFKDQPGVVGFEPINEPGWGSQDPDTFAATTLTTFYSNVVAHMRQRAPQSLVFVDPPGIDAATAKTMLQRPSGDGIVFAPHYYPVRETADFPPMDLPRWAAVGAAWNVPTFLGEFGTPEQAAHAAEYVGACFATLDTLGMGGTAWEYSIASEIWNGETFGFVDADGGASPTEPALMRPFARAVAGGSIVQSWDAPSATFALTYTPTAPTAPTAPNAGITEVQVPARAYPSGFDVTVSGGCYDAGSTPGRLLVRANDGASSVSIKVVTR
jgi:endoglycosylceramidase